MKRLLRLLFKLLLFLLALGASAELFGRFILGLGNPVLVQVDPACGYILKPDQHLTRFFARTDTNHFGMRSGPIEQPKRRYRVMFVGDSLTYGTSHIDQSDIFPEIIGRDLGIEILNASAGAWGIWNEVQYVRSRGTFDSDQIVLVLNNGDLTQPPATSGDASRDLPVTRPACALCELWARGMRPRLLGDPAQDAGLQQVRNQRQLSANLGELDELAKLVRPSLQTAALVVVYLPFRKDLPAGQRSSDLQDWARRNQAVFVDLTDTEQAYTVSAITLDGSHLSKFGHHVVATALEKLLPANKLNARSSLG